MGDDEFAAPAAAPLPEHVDEAWQNMMEPFDQINEEQNDIEGPGTQEDTQVVPKVLVRRCL